MAARRDDGGFATVQMVAAAALAIVVVALLANLMVLVYARGAVRAALDEGARLGARAPDPAATCTATAQRALGDLLGGTMRSGVTLHDCALQGDQVVAAADVSWSTWVTGLEDWTFTSRATALVTTPQQTEP